MTHRIRTRFWIEALLAAASLAAFVATLLAPSWIEQLFGVDPDGGSGALEAVIATALVSSAVVTSVLARAEWQRAATA